MPDVQTINAPQIPENVTLSIDERRLIISAVRRIVGLAEMKGFCLGGGKPTDAATYTPGIFQQIMLVEHLLDLVPDGKG